jgi:hypothetical protein
MLVWAATSDPKIALEVAVGLERSPGAASADRMRLISTATFFVSAHRA